MKFEHDENLHIMQQMRRRSEDYHKTLQEAYADLQRKSSISKSRAIQKLQLQTPDTDSLFSRFLDHRNYKTQTERHQRQHETQAARAAKFQEIMNSTGMKSVEQSKQVLGSQSSEHSLAHKMHLSNLKDQQRVRNAAIETHELNRQELTRKQT